LRLPQFESRAGLADAKASLERLRSERAPRFNPAKPTASAPARTPPDTSPKRTTQHRESVAAQQRKDWRDPSHQRTKAMEIVVGFLLLTFDLAGLLALGHYECGWRVPLLPDG
jgi:hypothetical protein